MIYTRVMKKLIFPPDVFDPTKDSQKKNKRKGRNKQEVLMLSPAEPEPEAVRTPIDLMKVSAAHIYLQSI